MGIIIKREHEKLSAYENGNKIARIIVFKDRLMTTKVIPENGSIIDKDKKIKLSRMVRCMELGDLNEIDDSQW